MAGWDPLEEEIKKKKRRVLIVLFAVLALATVVYSWLPEPIVPTPTGLVRTSAVSTLTPPLETSPTGQAAAQTSVPSEISGPTPVSTQETPGATREGTAEAQLTQEAGVGPPATTIAGGHEGPPTGVGAGAGTSGAAGTATAMAIAEGTPTGAGGVTPGTPVGEGAGITGTATTIVTVEGTPTGVGAGTPGVAAGEGVGDAGTATAIAIAEGTPTGVGGVTPGTPAGEGAGITGTASAMVTAEGTPTGTAVTEGEGRGTPGTPSAALDATPTAATLATPTMMLPAELPVTGGNGGLGTGWLAVGLVVLLAAAGIAALVRGTSGQKPR